MTINIKTEEFRQIWEFTNKVHKMNSKEYENFVNKNSRTEIAKSTMGAYAQDLIRAAELRGISLDLTYGTVSLLDDAFQAFFDEMTDECYNEEAMAVIIARSMAGYFTLLAINEENCHCEFKDKYSELMTNAAFDELLDTTFSGVSVTIGSDEKADLLLSAMRSIRTKENDYTSLYINILPILRAYEKATGVNLNEYGFVNFLLKQKPLTIE